MPRSVLWEYFPKQKADRDHDGRTSFALAAEPGLNDYRLLWLPPVMQEPFDLVGV